MSRVEWPWLVNRGFRGPIKIVVQALPSCFFGKIKSRNSSLLTHQRERERETSIRIIIEIYREAGTKSEPRKVSKITDFQHPLAAVTFNQRGNRDPENNL